MARTSNGIWRGEAEVSLFIGSLTLPPQQYVWRELQFLMWAEAIGWGLSQSTFSLYLPNGRNLSSTLEEEEEAEGNKSFEFLFHSTLYPPPLPKFHKTFVHLPAVGARIEIY